MIIRRKQPEDLELGSFKRHGTNSALLNAMKYVRSGDVYDLGLVRFHGMPLPAMHPPMEILTYRSTEGMINQKDQEWITGEANKAEFGFTSELVITCLHTGTHIDALSHANLGKTHSWYGGYSSSESVGNFGTLRSDASTLSPIISRGVLLDVAGLLGVDAMPAGAPIDKDLLERTMQYQNVQIKRGDVVLVRTGYMSQWPNRENLKKHAGSGITLDAAKWLESKDILAVGADTEAIEQFPSTDTKNPHPVHSFLLVEKGIFLIECLDLELLGRDKIYVFLFVSLPVKFAGGTAGLVDPIAIV